MKILLLLVSVVCVVQAKIVIQVIQEVGGGGCGDKDEGEGGEGDGEDTTAGLDLNGFEDQLDTLTDELNDLQDQADAAAAAGSAADDAANVVQDLLNSLNSGNGGRRRRHRRSTVDFDECDPDVSLDGELGDVIVAMLDAVAVELENLPTSLDPTMLNCYLDLLNTTAADIAAGDLEAPTDTASITASANAASEAASAAQTAVADVAQSLAASIAAAEAQIAETQAVIEQAANGLTTTPSQCFCEDQNGEIHDCGIQWQDTTEPCSIYACVADNVTEVARIDCPPPPCMTEPVYTEGECCPQFDCSATTPGECFCEDDSGQHPCGSHWDDPNNPCASHQCDDGVIATIMMSCFIPTCDVELTTVPGECCPICDSSTTLPPTTPEPTTPGCDSNVDTWTDPDDPCAFHSCEDGVTVTYWATCAPAPCPPRDGECCPSHDCTTTLETTEIDTTETITTPEPSCEPNGDTCTDHNDPCTFQTSQNGVTETFTVTCAPAPCPPRDGECCPNFDCILLPQCQDNGGVLTDPDDPCIYYTCENGVLETLAVTCAEGPCPPRDGECCPTYDCITTTPPETAGGCFCEDEFGRYPCETGWVDPRDSCIEYICENEEIRVGDCPIEYCPSDPTPYDLRCCPGCSTTTSTPPETTEIDSTTVTIADTTF